MPKRVWRFGPLSYALPARAVADTVRSLTSLRDVRAIVADAVQRRACTVPDLSEELNNGSTVGSKLFREALTDVAEGIHSAAEGDLKDLLAKSGLPMPLFNASIFDNDGTFIARPDAWWPKYGVAVEAVLALAPQVISNPAIRDRSGYDIVRVDGVTPAGRSLHRILIAGTPRGAAQRHASGITQPRVVPTSGRLDGTGTRAAGISGARAEIARSSRVRPSRLPAGRHVVWPSADRSAGGHQPWWPR